MGQSEPQKDRDEGARRVSRRTAIATGAAVVGGLVSQTVPVAWARSPAALLETLRRDVSVSRVKGPLKSRLLALIGLAQYELRRGRNVVPREVLQGQLIGLLRRSAGRELSPKQANKWTSDARRVLAGLPRRNRLKGPNGPNIIVRADGGRFDDIGRDLRLPNGSAVAFFEPDGGLLGNKERHAILGALQAGREPGGRLIEVLDSDQETYDYGCWPDPSIGDDNGVFEVGSHRRIRDLGQFDEGHPLLLSNIFAEYRDRMIYWLASREISPRDEAVARTPAA